MCGFEELFNDVSTRFGQSLFENSFKNAIQVDTFVEMFKMEIVEKSGTSCRRLIRNAFSTLENSSFGDHKVFKSNFNGQ